MPALFVETDPAGAEPPRFSTDSPSLLALISFGIAEPYGTQHPLTELVRRLKKQHGIDVEPLLTFYDRDTEDAQDEAKLEAAWQPGASLRDCLRAVRAALAADGDAAALAATEPQLPMLLAELELMAADAGTGRIRVSFSLTDSAASSEEASSQ